MHYESRAARALVLMQDTRLREFLPIWREAKLADVVLPETNDPSYASLDKLLVHVLGAARGYMVWMCEVLELSDPGIKSTPGVDRIEAEAEGYLKHVLECWRGPLEEVPGSKLEGDEYTSRWGESFTVDSMLEHAVMHPVRHGFQLQEMVATSTSASATS